MTDTLTVGLPLQWSCVGDVNPPEETIDPTVDKFLQRVSVTMPTPTLVNGRPSQPWEPTIHRSNWRRLHLHVAGGINVTKIRGKRFIPLNDRDTEPFGDADASFAFPGLTEYDDPSDWGLHPFAVVRLIGVDDDGNWHTEYEGEVASWEPDDGQGLVVHTLGAFYRTQLLREPPALIQTEEDLGLIIPRLVNSKRRQFALHLGHMAHKHTGITGVRGGDFSSMLDQIQTWLSSMTDDDGIQYTIKLRRPRTPVLVKKDTTTVDFEFTYGQPGAKVNAPVDHTSATTAVYATGTNGKCSWMGARFPHLEQQDTPAFPLGVGAFVAGDGQTGFAPFAAYLRRGQYGTIVSDDTYDPRDVDNVEQFQDRADITSDGVVDATTWDAAFQPGLNTGSVIGGYVGPIYEKRTTRKRKYNAQGGDIGRSSHFDAHVPRIEAYIPMGDGVSKNLGRRSGKQTVNRDYPAGRVGDIVFTLDPENRSRWTIRAGMNGLIKSFAGSDVLVHCIDVVRDRQAGTVTVSIDEKSRDLLTAAAIHQRKRDVADLTRRAAPARTRAHQFNDYGTWLCEDGAGEIPLMNQTAGEWNTQPISAAPKGTIERITLAMGSGLTEHLLNQALSNHPPSSIPGATRGAVLITTKPIHPNQITAMPGLDTPLHVMDDGTNPWDFNENRLNRFGKIFAAGGPGDGIGFYPNDNDPGDGSIDPTGLFEDGGGVEYGPTGHYRLWVSIWTEDACKVGGRIFPGAPN